MSEKEVRLIDANAMIEQVSQEPTDGMYTFEIVKLIKEQPDIDAAPVRHAYWQKCREDSSDNKTIYFRCSACKGYRFHNGAMRKKYKFCPNCGAKMDKEIGA